jgi:hypothetical protein
VLLIRHQLEPVVLMFPCLCDTNRIFVISLLLVTKFGQGGKKRKSHVSKSVNFCSVLPSLTWVLNLSGIICWRWRKISGAVTSAPETRLVRIFLI